MQNLLPSACSSDKQCDNIPGDSLERRANALSFPYVEGSFGGIVGFSYGPLAFASVNLVFLTALFPRSISSRAPKESTFDPLQLGNFEKCCLHITFVK